MRPLPWRLRLILAGVPEEPNPYGIALDWSSRRTLTTPANARMLPSVSL